MKKKIISTVFLFLLTVYPLLAQQRLTQFKVGVANFNKTYLLPFFFVVLGLWIIITGLMNMSDMREGGPKAKAAAISWLTSCLWPFAVIVFSEGILLIFAGFGQ